MIWSVHGPAFPTIVWLSDCCDDIPDLQSISQRRMHEANHELLIGCVPFETESHLRRQRLIDVLAVVTCHQHEYKDVHSKGYDLAKKYYYRYLQFLFDELEIPTGLVYNPEHYPLPNFESLLNDKL